MILLTEFLNTKGPLKINNKYIHIIYEPEVVLINLINGNLIDRIKKNYTTISQELCISEFPLIIKDKNDNIIYHEHPNGNWNKAQFDSNNNIIYYENSSGYWNIREYDNDNKLIYSEKSDKSWERHTYDEKGNWILYEKPYGFWAYREYDLNNKEIYYENSNGKKYGKKL